MYLKPLNIGNIHLKSNIFIAPLAGYTNLPTRLIYRNQGAGIAYAEMVSAEGLNYNFDKSVNLIKSDIFDRPLGVQLFGSNAERILSAFLKVKDYEFDVVDINCGCSVRKVIKSDSGAALLRNTDEIYKIIKLLKENTDKPVTLKIRSGWDEKNLNFLETLSAAENAGASLITFHPRTKSMLFEGKANRGFIKIMKEKSIIPVIGNGDIFTPEDALSMFENTKCDGIMLARGLIENPFLVEQIISYLETGAYEKPSIERRKELCIKHCTDIVSFMGERTGIKEFRKFFSGYFKGVEHTKVLRIKINSIENLNEFVQAVEEFK